MDKSSADNLEKQEELKLTFKKSRSKDGRMRPKSVSKYNGSGIDCNLTCKPSKRHSNPSVIEKILKKSLHRAKQQKLCRTKASKLKILKSELRKNEIDYRNKKIRLNNSLSLRIKRSRSKENPVRGHENTISLTMKTDSSPQTRQIDQVLLTTVKKTKKKIVSERKQKDSSILDYMKKKKSQRTKKEFQDKLTKKAEKFVKARNIAKLEEFITKSFRKSPEASFSSMENSFDPYKSGNFHDINRNISFIYENESEKSLEKDEEMSIVKAMTGKTFETDAKLTETQDDDRRSTDIIFKTRDFRTTIKSPEFTATKFHFPQNLEVQHHLSLSIPRAKPPSLSTSIQASLQISPKSPKRPSLSISKRPSIKIPSQPAPAPTATQDSSTCTVPSLCTSSQPPILIPRAKPSAKAARAARVANMKTSKVSVLALPGLPSQASLEHYSWNLALMFLIDQLHLYEISDISENFPNASAQVLKKIGKKFSGVKNFLQNSFERTNSQLLENLSFEQHTGFIQKTHAKKIEIQKVLTEIFEDSIETSEEDAKAGIAHSQSLQHLHESPERKEKNAGLVVSFGFEDHASKEEAGVVSISEGESSGNIMDAEDLKEFVETVFKMLDWDGVMASLKQPLIKNPLTELDKLQETQIGSVTETEIFNFPQLIEVERILKQVEELEKLEDFDRAYRKMVLDSINCLLHQFRPFGYQGMPLPWINTVRFEYKSLTLEDIQDKVVSDLLLLNSFEIGSIVEIDPWIKQPSESQLIKLKESQLDKILFFEAIIEESRWVYYEFEESQVKIDLSDMILQDLALELIKIVEYSHVYYIRIRDV